MPKIYLSPSTQQANMYVTGGSEEYHMNKLADAMEPYLYANGISFMRNTPDMTAGSVISQANRHDYDLHVALHSNAAGDGNAGGRNGTDIYYFPGSKKGKRAADIMVEQFRKIYPYTDKVRALPTTKLGEVDRVKAPSVFIETAFHDNPEDAKWIVQNNEKIARAIVMGLSQYFNLPFVEPVMPYTAKVHTMNMRSHLNIREKPALDAKVEGRIPNGGMVTVYGLLPSWAAVEYEDTLGFVSRRFLQS